MTQSTAIVKTLQSLEMLGMSLGTVGTRRSVVQGVQWFRGGCSSSNETNIERKVVDCEKGAKTRLVLRSDWAFVST